LQAFIVHRVLLGKLTVAQLAKKFPTLYGTWRSCLRLSTGPYTNYTNPVRTLSSH
jgi:hypothetical protein